MATIKLVDGTTFDVKDGVMGSAFQIKTDSLESWQEILPHLTETNMKTMEITENDNTNVYYNKKLESYSVYPQKDGTRTVTVYMSDISNDSVRLSAIEETLNMIVKKLFNS